VFFEAIGMRGFIDEMIFENFKNVNKNNREGVNILTTYLDQN
jgi:hypothetical protein